jgi:hypothetical protein
MKTICAWCTVLIKDGETVDGRVSHGICSKCFAAVAPPVEPPAGHGHRFELMDCGRPPVCECGMTQNEVQ